MNSDIYVRRCKIAKSIKLLDKDIHARLRTAVKALETHCHNIEDSVSALDAVVDVMSGQHQCTIYAMVASMLECDRSAASACRAYVDAAIAQFAEDLRQQTSDRLREAGLPDIFDLNAKVREEIMAEESPGEI